MSVLCQKRVLPLVVAGCAGLTVAPAAHAQNGPPAGPPPGGGGGAFEVELSNRAEYLSGGDVLVRIEVPRNVPPHQVEVLLDGQDVTSSFQPGVEDRVLLGLVEGLDLDGNQLVIDSNGQGRGRPTVDLSLTNYPITGPIFSGPHEEPFICMTDTFSIGPGAGTLGDPIDEQCSVATRVDYFYRTTGGSFAHLPDPDSLPGDVATATTLEGAEVPYVIRVETGTINRAIYQTAILDDPADPEPDPFTANAGWNGRLIYRFGGGCRTGWYVQGNSTGGVLDDTMLSQGYATASASLNVFGNNCNDLLTAETMMMVKERFIEAYGFPRHTIGWGCSGGSYQTHQIGDNYPGLLDGIISGCSFPEVGFATIHTITDARLLENYFNNLTAVGWTQEQERLVSGFGKWESIANLSTGANRIDPDSEFKPVVPDDLKYDPVSNPDGARATVYDHTINAYGVDPLTGFARRPLDNVGIQYGLEALNAGQISIEQFLDLNEKIGGFDIDANHVPERTTADLEATRLAYQTGRLLSGGGGLAEMPMIDYRSYTDLLPNGDIHMKFHSFSTEARLEEANGHADNQVMLGEDREFGGFSSESPVLMEALAQMDQWLVNIENDTTDLPRDLKVVANKPADLVDACWTPYPEHEKIVEEQQYGTGQCDAIYPSFPSPRMVAGGPIENDIVACQLKPLDPADYAVPLDGAQLAALEAIFPTGVCDWTQPGVEEQGLLGTWLSFGPSPVNLVDVNP